MNSSSSLRTDFTSGLVVLLPLLVCLVAILWVYNRIASVPLLRELVGQIPGVGTVVPVGITQVALTVVTTFLLVLTIGWLMRTAVGGVLETRLDALMNRVPVVRMVYNASKIAVETVLADDIDLNRPVKIEAWNGVYQTAFRTGKQTEDGRAVLFMPTAPNITSGFVLEVEESDIIDTDQTVEEALTRIISAGFGDNDSRPAPIEAVDEMSAAQAIEAESESERADEHEPQPVTQLSEGETVLEEEYDEQEVTTGEDSPEDA